MRERNTDIDRERERDGGCMRDERELKDGKREVGEMENQMD